MSEKLTLKVHGAHHIEVISAIDGTVLRLVPENGGDGVSIGLEGHPSVHHTELRPWLQPQPADVPPAIEERACPAPSN